LSISCKLAEPKSSALHNRQQAGNCCIVIAGIYWQQTTGAAAVHCLLLKSRRQPADASMSTSCAQAQHKGGLSTETSRQLSASYTAKAPAIQHQTWVAQGSQTALRKVDVQITASPQARIAITSADTSKPKRHKT
jgi:hypothetical protein